jgi:hypothetical protein
VPTGYSTIPDAPPQARLRRARFLRRITLAALAIFLILGLAGVWGVRTTTTTVTDGGYEVTVTYAKVSRPGLATPWAVDVRRPGGFDGPVTVAASSGYLEMFDENGLDPDASKSTQDKQFVIWEFEPPDGDTLVISFDARIEPAVQWARDGVVQVREDGRPVVEVPFKTWVMP